MIDSGTSIPGEAAPSAQPQSAYERDEARGDDAPDMTERARSQGWVPKEEFRGDPEKWRPADEFVKRGEEIVPILKERTKTLSSKLEQAEAKLRDQDTRFAKLEKMTEVALIRQRDQLAANYDAAKRAAVEMGDTARYDQLNRDQRVAMDAHERQITEAVVQAAPQRQDPTQTPEYQGTVSKWTQANPWFNADAEMQTVATIYSNDLAKKTPSITLADNLKATEAYIKKRYADKFPSAQPTGSSMVEGGGRMSASAQRGRGVNDLPADAKKQGEKFVSQGLFKNLAEYAADYHSQ